MNAMKVYMAGSMNTTGGDWRDGWRPHGLPDLSYGGHTSTGKWVPRGETHQVLVKGNQFDYLYVGPYGDDMGKHSARHGADFVLYSGEGEIFSRSKMGIRMADAVIALIRHDPIDCYGTLAEIGYAHGLRKPIYLILSGAEPDDSDAGELWFVASMAERCLSVSPLDERETLRRMLHMAHLDWLARRRPNVA